MSQHFVMSQRNTRTYNSNKSFSILSKDQLDQIIARTIAESFVDSPSDLNCLLSFVDYLIRRGFQDKGTVAGVGHIIKRNSNAC